LNCHYNEEEGALIIIKREKNREKELKYTRKNRKKSLSYEEDGKRRE